MGKQRVNGGACSVKGCANTAVKCGFCSGHHWRSKHGKPLDSPLRPTRIYRPDETCHVEECDRLIAARGYCQSHYAALLLHGDPLTRVKRSPGSPIPDCSVGGCAKPARHVGLCNTHYQRQRRGIPLDRPVRTWKTNRPRKAQVRKPRQNLSCEIAGCERPRHSAGLCSPHYYRERRGLPMDHPVRQKGNGSINNGYRMIVRHGHPNANAQTGMIAEHRYVMAEMLGRPLLPGENVHHKNGIRDDNRHQNLELWKVSQPPGQRVVDLDPL